MKQKTTQILYSYWNDVRRGRLAPRRFDIEPARLAAILSETLILEREDAGNYRFRLAGTRICEQFGAEFRGTFFLDLWSEGDNQTMRQTLDQIASLGAVALITLEGVPADGQPALFELLLLPLVHTRSTIDRFLGSMSCMRPPFWLGHQPITSVRLIRQEIIWPDGRPHGFLEKLANHTPFASPATRGRIVRPHRRHFRVLDGGLSDTGRKD